MHTHTHTRARAPQVIQLYDTMNVRFGVMLVGPTGGGKTECYKTLQGAQTRMRQELRTPNQAFQVLRLFAHDLLAAVWAACRGSMAMLCSACYVCVCRVEDARPGGPCAILGALSLKQLHPRLWVGG